MKTGFSVSRSLARGGLSGGRGGQSIRSRSSSSSRNKTRLQGEQDDPELLNTQGNSPLCGHSQLGCSDFAALRRRFLGRGRPSSWSVMKTKPNTLTVRRSGCLGSSNGDHRRPQVSLHLRLPACEYLIEAGPPMLHNTSPRLGRFGFGEHFRAWAVVADSILHRVAAGQSQAFEQCLDRFGGLVWSLARRFCPTTAEAEDAVQEIFIDLWRSASRFDEAVSSEVTFVAMIARRRLIDRQRRLGRRPRSEPLPAALVSPWQTSSDRAELCDEAAQAAKASPAYVPISSRCSSCRFMTG